MSIREAHRIVVMEVKAVWRTRYARNIGENEDLQVLFFGAGLDTTLQIIQKGFSEKEHVDPVFSNLEV
jgi:hypothetical protein